MPTTTRDVFDARYLAVCQSTGNWQPRLLCTQDSDRTLAYVRPLLAAAGIVARNNSRKYLASVARYVADHPVSSRVDLACIFDLRRLAEWEHACAAAGMKPEMLSRHCGRLRALIRARTLVPAGWEPPGVMDLRNGSIGNEPTSDEVGTEPVEPLNDAEVAAVRDWVGTWTPRLISERQATELRPVLIEILISLAVRSQATAQEYLATASRLIADMSALVNAPADELLSERCVARWTHLEIGKGSNRGTVGRHQRRLTRMLNARAGVVPPPAGQRHNTPSALPLVTTEEAVKLVGVLRADVGAAATVAAVAGTGQTLSSCLGGRIHRDTNGSLHLQYPDSTATPLLPEFDPFAAVLNGAMVTAAGHDRAVAAAWRHELTIPTAKALRDGAIAQVMATCSSQVLLHRFAGTTDVVERIAVTTAPESPNQVRDLLRRGGCQAELGEHGPDRPTK